MVYSNKMTSVPRETSDRVIRYYRGKLTSKIIEKDKEIDCRERDPER